MQKRVIQLWVAVCLLVATAGVAQADLSPPTSAAAKAHNDQGNRYYKVQEFAKAIEEYQQGAEIEDAPIFLYNLGQCHRQLGHYDKAIWFYQRYLSSGNVDDQVAMYVRDFIKVMKAKKEQELKDKPPVEPEPRSSTVPKEATDSRRDARADHGASWYQDLVGWGLVGAGVVASGVGIGFLSSAASLESDAKSEPDQAERDRLRGDASSRRTVGTILTIAGGAVLIGGGIKLALVGGAKASDGVALWLAPSPNGVFVAGRF